MAASYLPGKDACLCYDGKEYLWGEDNKGGWEQELDFSKLLGISKKDITRFRAVRKYIKPGALTRDFFTDTFQ